MKDRSLFVRIVAIILCALMVGGALTAAISAFAADVNLAASPDTGSRNNVWVIVAAVVAVAGILFCPPLSYRWQSSFCACCFLNLRKRNNFVKVTAGRSAVTEIKDLF